MDDFPTDAAPADTFRQGPDIDVFAAAAAAYTDAIATLMLQQAIIPEPHYIVHGIMDLAVQGLCKQSHEMAKGDAGPFLEAVSQTVAVVLTHSPDPNSLLQAFVNQLVTDTQGMATARADGGQTAQ
jgi:hypothetical protein